MMTYIELDDRVIHIPEINDYLHLNPLNYLKLNYIVFIKQVFFCSTLLLLLLNGYKMII